MSRSKRSIINTKTRVDPDKQSIATPWHFIHALEQRFGVHVDFDLAADAKNAKAPHYFGLETSRNYVGPTSGTNSLEMDWSRIDKRHPAGDLVSCQLAYLNPPFGNLRPWARKLASCRWLPRWTVMLAPSSFDASWFQELRDQVLIEPIARIQFEGQDIVYPKGLALYTAGFGVRGLGGFWDWRVSYRDYCHLRDIDRDPAAHVPQELLKNHPPLSVMPDFAWTPVAP